MNFFGNDIENFTDMEFYNYAFERDWFSEKPPAESGNNNSYESLEKYSNSNGSNTQQQNSNSSNTSNNSNTRNSESTSTQTNETKPLSAIVRVIVHNTDASKKYDYVGKNIKVMLNDEVKEDNYFNGDSYTAVFLNVSSPQATIKVYIDGTLIKTQQADIESLAKLASYYTDIEVNI